MKTRCAWANGDELLTTYHDREWGVPLHDERGLFEFLILEGAQAGLSWLTILRKREHYRRVFDDFDPERVARYGAAKLRALLAHCVAEVPFYRERLRAAGLDPSDATPEALAQLPALERDDIRAHREEMVAESYRAGLIRYSTGGSTGQPLVFYTDLDKEARHNAYKLRCRAWHGILPGDIVTIAISPYDLSKGRITYRGPLRQATQEAAEE